MAKFVVFGASGFVGKALVKQLAEKNIPCTQLGSADIDLAKAENVPTIATQMEDGDTVIFLPAYTPEKGAAEERTLQNILMIKHTLAALKERSLARFVYVSSDAVYSLASDCVDERTPCGPQDLYGQMHALREQYVRQAIAPEKLTIFRPCAIYGADDSHNAYGVCRFIRSALQNGEIGLFGGGEEYRDHIHVDDFARIILASCTDNINGLFNVATGNAVRFAELAEMVRKSVKKPVRLDHKPRALEIRHRHYNTYLLHRTFPACPLRRIEDGVSELARQMQ